MRIVETSKLSLHRPALRAAYGAMQVLVDRDWTLHNNPGWDCAAVIALDGEEVVGGIVYAQDANDGEVSIKFAWCSPAAPRALSLMAGRMRAVCRRLEATELVFSHHVDNGPMTRLAAIVGAEPTSRSYRLRFQ